MKNSYNHIDELFQNGIEQAEIHPPQELWNQVSQSWDQVVKADMHSETESSSSQTSSTNSTQSSSSKLSSFTQLSSMSKWIVGVIGTTVVGGGVYLLSELTSPETHKKNQTTSILQSNPDQQVSIETDNGIQNENNSQELVVTGAFQNPGFSQNQNLVTSDSHQLYATGSKIHATADLMREKKDVAATGDQKLSGSHKDMLHGESSTLSEKSNTMGVKPILDLIQRHVRVEQIENRVHVSIEGLSDLNVVVKSVNLGTERMQSLPLNANFARGDIGGWELPKDGANLNFERKCYLDIRKELKLQVVVKILGIDKFASEKDFVIEKQIEVQPWIASGSEIIPNVFTPNGDGLNDEYYVNVREPKSFQMEISSAERSDLGTVFYANSIFDRWNGKKGDIICPEGKYWVLIRRVYERIDNQGKWVTSTKVERILMELKRD